MSVTRPRGPLPARVYWVRRVMVLALAFGLVFGLARLFGGGTEDSPAPAAQPAPGPVTTQADPQPVSTADARPDPTATPGKKRARPSPAMPSGPCEDSDVKVVPTVPEPAYEGENVLVRLKLRTFESPACTWEVSSESVVVKLTSGSDRIWSSQECPTAVPTEAVTLRKRSATTVDMVWSGRRSDPECSRMTEWARPGWYHVSAAAMGSEPKSLQFELRPLVPITITPTPSPRPKDKQGERQDASPRGDG